MYEVSFPITVSGGTGQTQFAISVARIDTIVFDVPGNETYDYEIIDRNNRGVVAKTGLTGDTVLVVNRICLGTNTLIISSASGDGIYTITIRMRKY